MFLRIGHAGSAISEIFAQLVARYNHHADVDASLAESGVQMDHIHYQEIASCRNLYLNANADACAVHNLALDPVHIARDFPCPAAEPVELLVNEFSDGRAPV